MFDPLFPVALVCGPLAWAALLWNEARRATVKIWPSSVSLLLTLPSVWGLSNWATMTAVIIFGDGMNQAGFERAALAAIMAAVCIVIGSYCLLAVRRKRRISASD